MPLLLNLDRRKIILIWVTLRKYYSTWDMSCVVEIITDSSFLHLTFDLQVIRFIEDGILLQKPSDCPSVVYHVMLGCWRTDPKERYDCLTD